METLIENIALFLPEITDWIIGLVIVSAIVCIGTIYLLTSRHAPRQAQLHTELKDKDGFIGVDMSPEEAIGKVGEAMTDLRPAGKVIIDNKIYDATSIIEFIHRKSKVRVVKYEAAQIYVEPIKLP